MTAPVFLYDASNIEEYVWPKTEDGNKAKKYLTTLIKEGAHQLLENVSTKTFLITCGDVFLPLTVNEKEYDNAYIASNFYGIKYYEENISKRYPFLAKLQKPLLLLGSVFLKLFQINKTIFLNNWLMTNSLSPKISEDELTAIARFLIKQFPKHILIFRHVDNLMKKDLFKGLKESDFKLLKTREIFFYEPADRKETSKCRGKDLKILKKYDFEIVTSEGITENDYSRLLELYENVYVKKYTKFSPRYTIDYIKKTHQQKLLNYVAIKRQGVIEGFLSHFTYNQGMIFPLFGYDKDAKHAHDLYKIMMRIGIEESEKTNMTLNDGSGGDAAKLMRGMKLSTEYMGVYSSHLPLPRRFLWKCLSILFKLFDHTSRKETVN